MNMNIYIYIKFQKYFKIKKTIFSPPVCFDLL